MLSVVCVFYNGLAISGRSLQCQCRAEAVPWLEVITSCVPLIKPELFIPHIKVYF